jgi:hypothetical protein
METKVVSYAKGSTNYRIVVSEETALTRMRRSTLKLQAVNMEEQDSDIRVLNIVFYPDCVAAVKDWGLWSKPSFEEFQNLPGEFVDNWTAAVWELNPKWRPGAEEDEDSDAEKKV